MLKLIILIGNFTVNCMVHVTWKQDVYMYMYVEKVSL